MLQCLDHDDRLWKSMGKLFDELLGFHVNYEGLISSERNDYIGFISEKIEIQESPISIWKSHSRKDCGLLCTKVRQLNCFVGGTH